MIAIEGTLRTGNYQDKKYPDVTHYTTDVLVENVEFCGSKSDNSNPSANTSAPQQNTTASREPSPDFGSMSEFEEILSDADVPF